MFLFQVFDESSAVFDETGVLPYPDLKYAAFTELVCGPQNEAHAIPIAKETEETVFLSCFMVGSVWKETDTVAIDRDGVIREEDQLAVILVEPCLDDFQGV